MKNFLIPFLFVLPLWVSSQNKSALNKDGWRDLNWGATLQDVQSKYNTAKYDKENNSAVVNSYELTGRKFKLIFHFDSSTHLKNVTLNIFRFYDKEMRFRFTEREQMGSLQNDIESGLISKFGNPSFVTNSPNYLRVWNFPNLKIEVSSSIDYKPKLTASGTIDDSELEDDLVWYDSFTIEYSKPNNQEADKF